MILNTHHLGLIQTTYYPTKVVIMRGLLVILTFNFSTVEHISKPYLLTFFFKHILKNVCFVAKFCLSISCDEKATRCVTECSAERPFLLRSMLMTSNISINEPNVRPLQWEPSTKDPCGLIVIA